MRTIKIVSLVIALIACIFTGISWASINIDGNLEWINWDGVGLFEEDTPQWMNFLGPGYGGQNFDVEFLALYNTGNRIYFGLQTGFDVRGPVMGFRPGDFALDIDCDLEYDYAIDFKFADSSNVTYDLVDVCTWREVMYPSHSEANPFEYKTGSIIGNFNSLEFGYFCDSGGGHYILEGCLDASDLDLDSFGCTCIQWTMECGNDIGRICDSPPIPEPGTLLLFGSSIFGMLLKRYY